MSQPSLEEMIALLAEIRPTLDPAADTRVKEQLAIEALRQPMPGAQPVQLTPMGWSVESKARRDEAADDSASPSRPFKRTSRAVNTFANLRQRVTTLHLLLAAAALSALLLAFLLVTAPSPRPKRSVMAMTVQDASLVRREPPAAAASLTTVEQPAPPAAAPPPSLAGDPMAQVPTGVRSQAPVMQPGAPRPDRPVTSPQAAPATPRISPVMRGNDGRGASVVKRCNACHQTTKTRTVTGQERTSVQWARFFGNGSHDRAVPLGGRFNLLELADVMAYLMSRSIDRPRAPLVGDQGAGAP